MSLKETLMKPLITGAIAAGVSAALIGVNDFPIAGMNIPGPLFIGAVVTAADYAGEVGQNYVLPMVGGDSQLIGALVQPVLSGGILAGGLLLIGIEGEDAMYGFGLGAGSAIASDYAYRNFIAPQ